MNNIIDMSLLRPRETDKLFKDSPDAGHPDCICSRCGGHITEDEMPWRLFVEGKNAEYRFCSKCVEKKPSNSRMPDFYVPPLGLPFNWEKEQSGKLKEAIFAYLNYGTDNSKKPNDEQLTLIIDYLKYFINAPCWKWDGGNELEDLRKREMKNIEDIKKFIWDCLEIGLDPL